MLPGNAKQQPIPPFSGQSPRLAAAQPSNQACGESLREQIAGDGSGAIKVLLDLDDMLRQEFC